MASVAALPHAVELRWTVPAFVSFWSTVSVALFEHVPSMESTWPATIEPSRVPVPPSAKMVEAPVPV